LFVVRWKRDTKDWVGEEEEYGRRRREKRK
jgi:hypothetical protein